jgi:CubicO group peptidase (beta-lactamase class C family)
VTTWDLPTFAGAGALRSTVNDLLTFIEANLGMPESPLHAAIEATHRSQRSIGQPNLDIGLGWVIRSQYGRDIVWHNGGTGGYGSFLGFDMASGTGVVVLSNATNSPDDLGFHLLDQRFELIAAPEERTEVQVDHTIYDDYVGRYQLTMNMIITVTREDDQLFVQLTGQQQIEVFPESETDFFMRVVDAQITFQAAGDGTVPALTLHQGGQDLTAKKLPD